MLMILFSLKVLCFPFTIGKVKITVFHFLVSCTFIFSLLWGYAIYNAVYKALQEEVILVPLTNSTENKS